MQEKMGGYAVAIGKYGSEDLLVCRIDAAAEVEHGPFRIRLVQPAARSQQVEVSIGDVSMFGYSFPGSTFSLTIRGEPWVVSVASYQGTFDECRADFVGNWPRVSRSCHFV